MIADYGSGIKIKPKIRWGLMILIAVASLSLTMLGISIYRHPGVVNDVYPSQWFCDDDWCGLFMDTPDGPMTYPIPPKIRSKIEQQSVKMYKV